MTRLSLLSDQRAVSNMVSVVLLTGIVLVGLGTVVTIGYTQVGAQQDNFNAETASNQLSEIKAGISSVIESPTKFTRVMVNFGEQGGAASVTQDTGSVEVTVESSDDDPDRDWCTNLEYGGGDRQSIYTCLGDYGGGDTNVDASVDSGWDGPPAWAGNPNPTLSVTADVSSSSDITYGKVVVQPDDDSDYEPIVREFDSGGEHTYTIDLPEDYPIRSVDVVAWDEDGYGNADRDPYRWFSQSLVPGQPPEPDTPPMISRDLGKVSYQMSGDTEEIAYQNGGLIQASESGNARFVESPNIEVRRAAGDRADTVVFPITNVTEGDQRAISSSAQIEHQDTTTHYEERYLPEDKYLRVELTSEHASLWADYIDRELGSHAEIVGETENTVVVRIGYEEELYVQLRTHTVQVSG